MHMDMSPEGFARKFSMKTPEASDTTSIEHRALTPNYRKNLQCGHAVWGIKNTKDNINSRKHNDNHDHNQKTKGTTT